MMGIVLSTAQSQGGLLTLFSPARRKNPFYPHFPAAFSALLSEKADDLSIYSKSSHQKINTENDYLRAIANERLPFKGNNVKKAHKKLPVAFTPGSYKTNNKPICLAEILQILWRQVPKSCFNRII